MERQIAKKRSYFFSILLSLTILSGIFWLVGLNIDVYKIAFVGAVFEILWLPVVLSCIVVPVACLILWGKNRLSLKSRYLYLMLVSAAITFYAITSGNT